MNKTLPVIVLIVGLAMICVGLFFLKVPGQFLTDSSYLKPEKYPVIAGDGSNFSYIEQYVGGDAYNYIIGASLVGSRITGLIVAKTVLVAGGILIACIGIIGLCLANSMSILHESISYFRKSVTDQIERKDKQG